MSEEMKEEMKSDSKTTESGEVEEPGLSIGRNESAVNGFQKVDFHGRGSRTIAIWWLSLLILTIIILWSIADLQARGHLDFNDLTMILWVALLFYSFLVMGFWYFLWKYRNRAFLITTLGVTCSFIGFTVIYIAKKSSFETIEENQAFGICCSLFSLSLIFLLYGFFHFRRYYPLSIFPTIIASAERGTDEYLDGYSQRPLGSTFVDFDMTTMKRYTRFLLNNMLLWKSRATGESVTLYLPASGSWALSPFRKKSYVMIHKDGNTEVFISQKDYSFLQVPISYHLLCENMVKRLRWSYELFTQGDEKEALGVFRVEKVKGIRRRRKDG